MLLYKIILNFFKCLILFAIVHKSKAEYYSSVQELEKLIEMEENYITAAESYLSEVQKSYSKIESFLDKIGLEHKHFNNNEASYFLKPMNAFKLIKRLVVDWKHYDEIRDMQIEFNDFNKSITEFETNYTKPTAIDLQGAAQGLSRLQDMYHLDTEKIAQGYIFDHKYSKNFKAHDSYIMGLGLYDSQMFSKASEWFIHAVQQLDNDLAEGEVDAIDEFPFISYSDVLEKLETALYYDGHLKLAKFVNQQLLDLDPENEYALANKELYETAVIEEKRSMVFEEPFEESKLNTLYAQLCSSELTQTDAELRLLQCRYVTNNVPFYFIGPLKMEELNHDPFVAFFHQTIYDSEIEYIMKQVKHKMSRCTVAKGNRSELRTCKLTWLYWNEHEFIKTINQRLEDITGLSLATGEAMQVASYGIGGHYVPHYDFSENKINFFGKDENRILTAMFYISDVELGGATAFPFLRLAVPPIKRSLLVWYNMHDSTEVDYRTKHAGCPVIKGSKWICNEWFRDVGQELKRPCGVKPVADKYEYLKYIA